MQMQLQRTRTNQNSYQVEHDEIDWQSRAEADTKAALSLCASSVGKGENLAINLKFQKVIFRKLFELSAYVSALSIWVKTTCKVYKGN